MTNKLSWFANFVAVKRHEYKTTHKSSHDIAEFPQLALSPSCLVKRLFVPSINLGLDARMAGSTLLAEEGLEKV